ncbi:hypothetical protein JQ581_35350 [Bradyrhizobium liaoningense]|uniref:hypothetical protein n=1 Tax=Bradyrhizobium liaoningense TaxID=43992 RepID=UPI001BAC2BE2|nr:hypothetical protein [Bradyrhizobium liaoningense]MBR0742228.1 hypothetical protein [Bradyrhizobium liaoningense]
MSAFDIATSKAADSASPMVSSFRRFTVGFIGFVAIPPLALSALIVLVDPYYVFGTPDIPGINVVRPRYENHDPAVKPYQVQRIKPDAVTLGSSRAEVALDPQHPAWNGKKVFNFGLPSATSYEVMLAFLHAQSVAPLKQAVIGLDFFGFNIFFPRDQAYLEGRFAGDGVRAFADFLTAELAKRRPGHAGQSSASSAPRVSGESVRTETQPAPPTEAPTDPDCKTLEREKCLPAGTAENDPPAGWNEALYLRLYPDVAAEVRRGTFVSGYHHYLAAGRAEGRQNGAPPPGWNEAQYLRIYPDVAAEVRRGTFVSGYHHYLAAGRAEGRQDGTPPPGWNEELYLRVNSDARAEVARGTFVSGYHHYLAAGKVERREGGFIPKAWNDARYLQVNRDVEYQVSQGLFLNGYHHYLAAGRAEKRMGGFLPDGWNEANYLSRNPDARIRLALGEYGDGYSHYAAVGQKQGLTGGLPPADFSDALLSRWQALGKAAFQIGELFHLVFSATAVNDAITTLRGQSEPPTFDGRGMRIWDGQDDNIRKNGGNGRVFRDNILSWRWYIWLMPPRYMYCFGNPDTGMSSFDAFRFLVRRAHERGTDLRLFMTPLHTSVRQLFVALGLSDRYEFWQSELVRINEEEAARAGRKPFALWDFSDANSVTREIVPERTDLTPMRWFWEFSHYRHAAGNLVLDRILGHIRPESAPPADFGVRLTGENISAHLAHSRAGIAGWAAANPEFAAQISAATQGPKVQNRQNQVNCW